MPQPIRTEEAFRLLCAAGAALSSSLKYEAALGGMARLLTDSIADLCLVDLGGQDGSVARLATAHRDPSLAIGADEIGRFAPDPQNPRDPIARVLFTGDPLLVEEIDESWFDASLADPDYRKALRSLGLAGPRGASRR